MTAHIPIRTPFADHMAEIDRLRDEARAQYEADLARATTHREREEARRTYAARLPQGWIIPKREDADLAVLRLIDQFRAERTGQ